MPSNSYNPPGVSVTEFIDPSISPLLAIPATVGLVGKSEGEITRTEAIVLTATSTVEFDGVPSDATMSASAVTKVVDATDPALSEAESGGVYPEGEGGWIFDNSAHTIRRGSSSVIPDGNTVHVTYSYTPADYFQAIRLDNLQDIEARFGSAYNSDGTAINSVLTYAAGVAFENGAQDVILQPLFYDNSGTREQPSDAQAADATVWATNFVALRDVPDINLLVPVVGQSAPNVGDSEQRSIVYALQDHIKFMKDVEQQYVLGLFGYDSTADAAEATAATLRADAALIQARYAGDVSEQLVFVTPSKFNRNLPTGANNVLSVGGQYMAAGLAGMIASRPISQSLTRKFVSGFSNVGEARSRSAKNEDANSGLLVVEQKGNFVRVRHAVTLNTDSTAKREVSIVRAKHRVIESLRDTIEEQIIGEVVADGEAAFVIRSTVIGVLEELRNASDLVDFADVQARTKSVDPTEIEVRFSYRPAFPVNFVSIGFSLDLSTGDLSLDDTTNVDTSAV